MRKWYRSPGSFSANPSGQSHFRFGRGGLQGNRCSSQLV
jgi:hypothetical protein